MLGDVFDGKRFKRVEMSSEESGFALGLILLKRFLFRENAACNFEQRLSMFFGCRTLLEKELESVGIRLNKKRPNIYFKQKKGGGLKFTNTCPLTHLNERIIYSILHEYSEFVISNGNPFKDLRLYSEFNL